MKKIKEDVFYGEIREVKSKKTTSGDMEYTLQFVTENPFLLDLGKLPAMTLFELTIKTAK